MSFAGFSSSSLVAPGATQGVIRPKRSIGGLVADVTIEENATDEVEITQHPVEKTADITDHAYPLPARLTVKIGYSQSGSSVGGAFGVNPYAGDPVPLQTIYQQYLTMKDARTLMEVQTGKRLYKNMLIKTITLVTDQDTENALFLSIALQAINLVETQTVSVPQNSVQKVPQITGNQLSGGVKQVTVTPRAQPQYSSGGGSGGGGGGGF